MKSIDFFISPKILSPLPNRVKRLYAFIHYRCLQQQGSLMMSSYTNIPHSEIRQCVCNNDPMKDIRTYLSEYIEVNNKYSTGTNDVPAFTKSYRILQDLFEDQEYEVLPIRDRVRKNSKKIVGPSLIEIDPIKMAIHSNASSIVATPNIEALSKFTNSMFNTLLWSFYTFPRTKARRISQPSGSRIFDFMSVCVKEFRHFMTRHGRHLVEVDVKTCIVAWILTQYPTNSIEKKKMQEIYLTKDFYQLLAGTNTSRDEIKNKFIAYVSTHEDYKKRNVCHSIFSKEFPEMLAILNKDPKKIQANYQQWESDIMIRGVLVECIRKSIFAIPLHDCIFTDSPEKARTIQGIISKHFAAKKAVVRTEIEEKTLHNLPTRHFK